MKDIHNIERQFKRAYELCQEELPRSECISFTRYASFCIAKGIKKIRIVKILGFLRRTTRLTDRTLANLTENELIDLLAKINSLDMSGPSRNDHIIILRGYLNFAWRHKRNKFESVKDLLRKRRCDDVRRPARRIFPEDLPAIVAAAEQPEMKILVCIFWESWARVQEILGLRREDVVFGEFNGMLYAILHVEGKTGRRPVMIIDYAPLLKKWCDASPGEEYVFTYNYGAWNKHKQEIEKKIGFKLYAHLFRKSSASWWGKCGMPDPLRKMRMGLTPDSNVLKHYDFNGCEDANEVYLRMCFFKQQSAKSLWPLNVSGVTNRAFHVPKISYMNLETQFLT